MKSDWLVPLRNSCFFFVRHMHEDALLLVVINIRYSLPHVSIVVCEYRIDKDDGVFLFDRVRYNRYTSY